MYKAAIFLGMLPVAFGHIGLWHPSAFDFDGDGYTLVEPLSGKSFDQWWFHGNLDKKPTGSPMELPAGGKVTVELACNKEYTSYGNGGDGQSACPTDIPSYHAGDPIDESHLLGCGLAIAYKDDANDVQPEDFTIFSVNDKCVNGLYQDFEVPALPECPNGKCICAWFWQGQDSSNEMYMTGFECTVTGDVGTQAVGAGQPPKYCADGGCVSGPKQPMYWANDRSKIDFSGDYFNKPSYNSKWGFSNGAQSDIFTGASTGSSSSPSASAAPSASPAPTTLITSTRSSQATSAPSNDCAWPGHCAGATCESDNDCSDVLTCSNGKCGN